MHRLGLNLDSLISVYIWGIFVCCLQVIPCFNAVYEFLEFCLQHTNSSLQTFLFVFYFKICVFKMKSL